MDSSTRDDFINDRKSVVDCIWEREREKERLINTWYWWVKLMQSNIKRNTNRDWDNDIIMILCKV